MMTSIPKFIMCSECFNDFGLKYNAQNIGVDNQSKCPLCGCYDGKKLTQDQVYLLCQKFFVEGSYEKTEFGGASILNVTTDGWCDLDIPVGESLKKDMSLLLKKLGIGVIYASPQMWRVGFITWLEDLSSTDKKIRNRAIEKTIARMNSTVVGTECEFFRMRLNIIDGILDDETFDAPPAENASRGRLNKEGSSVMYGAFDIETCIHECRAKINDTLYVAVIQPLFDLKLLDFTKISEDCIETTPFEMLEIAMGFLFTASDIAYDITQSLAIKAKEIGFDGIIYPSFFNQVRIQEYRNIALFGRPVEEKKVCVKCINKLKLERVSYNYSLGPAYQ